MIYNVILAVFILLAFIGGYYYPRKSKPPKPPEPPRCQWLIALKADESGRAYRSLRCRLTEDHEGPHFDKMPKGYCDSGQDIWWTSEEDCAYRPGMKLRE